jgi:hypothetical protein
MADLRLNVELNPNSAIASWHWRHLAGKDGFQVEFSALSALPRFRD